MKHKADGIQLVSVTHNFKFSFLNEDKMDEDKNFLRQDNNYRSLKAFQKAECIYDVTFYFAHKFLKTGDRTIDKWFRRLGRESRIWQRGTLTASLREKWN